MSGRAGGRSAPEYALGMPDYASPYGWVEITPAAKRRAVEAYRRGCDSELLARRFGVARHTITAWSRESAGEAV